MNATTSPKNTDTTPSRASRRGLASERGATMVEYALLISGIAIAAVFGVAAVGLALDDTYEDAADRLDEAAGIDGAIGTPGSTGSASTGSGGSGSTGSGSGASAGSGTGGGSQPTTTTTSAPETTTITTTAGGGGQGAKPNQSASTGLEGEFTVTFVEIDGVVEIASIEADGWTYEVTMDKDHQIHITFFKDGYRKDVKVKGWLTGNGKLKVSTNR